MIAVIGLGPVGLTTALGFAHKRYKVYGFDADTKLVERLKKGIIPLSEPYLREYLEKHKKNNFHICNTLKEAVTNAKFIFYCIGTPSKDSGEADLEPLQCAIRDSLGFIDKSGYKVLVVKSTVPPSTTKRIIRPLIEREGFSVGKDIGLANNPEFLREGSTWKDFINPDRIVIGECDKKTGLLLDELYRPFDTMILRVSFNTAEFIKYLSNTFLSTMISFSNEMSMVADAMGDVDITNSFKILHLDKRWHGNPAAMTSYLYPGCGFGGYCLPKDTLAIYSAAKAQGYDSPLIREVLKVNDKIKEYFAKRIIGSTHKDSYVGILGLSFKPGSGDVRNTAAKDIIRGLIDRGYDNIIAYDPAAMDDFKETYGLPIAYADTFEEVIKRCETIVLLTAWEEFKVKSSMLKGKKVIDGRYFI